MKCLLFLLLTLPAAAQSGSSLSWYIDASNGGSSTTQLQTLPTSYTFPDTSVGSASGLVIRVVNTGSSNASLNVVYIGATAGSPTSTANFSVTGAATNATILPGHFLLFTVHFTPAQIGNSVGYLQANDGVSSYGVAMLSGTGTPPQLTLSCSYLTTSQCNGGILQPSSSSALDFGVVTIPNTLTIPFTLSNNSSTAVSPASLVTIATPTNNPSTAFTLAGLPATLVPGASAPFNLVFAPGAANVYQTALVVNGASYLIRATGQANVVGDLGSLVVTYTDSLGVRLTAQGASVISFAPQVAAASNATGVYSFTVTNPATTIQAVPVSNIAVTGAGFVLDKLPALPASIAPGASLSFTVAFQPTSAGTYNGTLTLGTRQFALLGKGTQSSVATPTFALDVMPLISAKQVHLSVTLSAASQIANAGTLTLAFTPATAIGKDDPAIVFLATGGRQLNVLVAQNSQTLTYEGDAAIGFQSGTTAGTLTFTLAFPNAEPYTQSYNITPSTMLISSATATAQDPNLVVTMTGYDNTASAGKMAFTFYDSSGKPLLADAVPVDATADFKNFFSSGSNVTGGAFTIQLKFPVTGDISRIANMGIALTNSAGTTNVKQ